MKRVIEQRRTGPLGLCIILGALLAIAGTAPPHASAQVMVAPPVVIMDDANRITHYLVHNTSGQAQEVSVEFRFGYPHADADGRTRMVYDDEEAERRHSIAGSVRAFPRQFVLQPGQRQRVRIMLTGEGEREEGGHWTRIVTSAVPVSPPVDTIGDGGITTRIAIRTNTVTALIYRRGASDTGLRIDDLSPDVSNGELILRARLARTGNSPFLGRRIMTVRDESGAVVHEAVSNIAVYFDQTRAFRIGLPDLPPGTYTGELRFESSRSDVPSSNLLPIEPVSATVSLVLPPD